MFQNFCGKSELIPLIPSLVEHIFPAASVSPTPHTFHTVGFWHASYSKVESVLHSCPQKGWAFLTPSTRRACRKVVRCVLSDLFVKKKMLSILFSRLFVPEASTCYRSRKTILQGNRKIIQRDLRLHEGRYLTFLQLPQHPIHSSASHNLTAAMWEILSQSCPAKPSPYSWLIETLRDNEMIVVLSR